MRARLLRIPPWIPVFLLVVAGVARAAEDLLVEELGIRDGQLTTVVRLPAGFDQETRESIQRGLPITVRFTTELWRKRRLWFDKQEASRVRSFRVRYDPGEKLYSVEDSGRRRRRETFESLGAALDRLSPRLLEILPREELEGRHTYYVTVEMAIQPLTLEEFRELDGWISGRIHGDEDEEGSESPEEQPSGDEGGVSGTVFGLFRDLAGFGDRIHRAETPPFRVASLGETESAP